MENTQHVRRSEDALVGRRVTGVRGGDRLDLVLDGPVTVRVTQEFRLAGATGVGIFYPALTFRPTRPLLGLVGRTVSSARVTPAGGLELVFAGEGGGTLSVPPHALLGPWRVVTPDGTLCAGLPGGEVVRSEGPDPVRPPGRPRSW
ncbi:DUF6188 family protein [Kitasatospora sp. NPDC059463]|uniref:DUF6188 family protein n=1 Tax=unclassified Kitasatospora TaxID=2633591 RepID=UPI0036A473B5